MIFSLLSISDIWSSSPLMNGLECCKAFGTHRVSNVWVSRLILNFCNAQTFFNTLLNRNVYMPIQNKNRFTTIISFSYLKNHTNITWKSASPWVGFLFHIKYMLSSNSMNLTNGLKIARVAFIDYFVFAPSSWKKE